MDPERVQKYQSYINLINQKIQQERRQPALAEKFTYLIYNIIVKNPQVTHYDIIISIKEWITPELYRDIEKIHYSVSGSNLFIYGNDGYPIVII